MYLTYITITQSTIITSPIRFNKGLTNVHARLKQRCINVVPTLCKVVSTLCNVVSTLFRRRALTLYQRCATLKIRRRILFHFQRRINVISTLIHNVETILIRRWNGGWVFSEHLYLRTTLEDCFWKCPYSRTVSKFKTFYYPFKILISKRWLIYNNFLQIFQTIKQ